MRTNNAQDFGGATVVVDFFEEPSVWIGLSGNLLEIYERGTNNFFTKYGVSTNKLSYY